MDNTEQNELYNGVYSNFIFIEKKNKSILPNNFENTVSFIRQEYSESKNEYCQSFIQGLNLIFETIV